MIKKLYERIMGGVLPPLGKCAEGNLVLDTDRAIDLENIKRNKIKSIPMPMQAHVIETLWHILDAYKTFSDAYKIVLKSEKKIMLPKTDIDKLKTALEVQLLIANNTAQIIKSSQRVGK